MSKAALSPTPPSSIPHREGEAAPFGEPKLNIYQRINEVRKKVSYVKKDKKVDGAGYMAVTHDAVTAILRDAMIEFGIVVVPTLTTSTFVETGTTTAKGIPFMRYEGAYEVAFVNCEEPADRTALVVESHAIDQGDKAPGKALSYAVKYAELKIFMLESGEDDEGRAEQKRAKILPSSGVYGSLDAETKALAQSAAVDIQSMYDKGDLEGAYSHYLYVKANLDADGMVGMWSLLDSKCRSKLKARNKAAEAAP